MIQGLDATKASSTANHVLDKLKSANQFIEVIEQTFTNHQEIKESRKRLKAALQGNDTIEKFNIIFNLLLYMVDLSDASKCEFYEDTINPGIVQLGWVRGGWKGVTNLAVCQEMAATFSANKEGINFVKNLNFNKSSSQSNHPSGQNQPS